MLLKCRAFKENIYSIKVTITVKTFLYFLNNKNLVSLAVNLKMFISVNLCLLALISLNKRDLLLFFTAAVLMLTALT